MSLAALVSLFLFVQVLLAVEGFNIQRLANPDDCFGDRTLITTARISIRATPSHLLYERKTPLYLSKDENPDEKDMGSITGTDQGVWLLGLAVICSVWFFTIPTEFRRSRLCDAEQVKLYPESKCITPSGWWSGVTGYYANGGGISWDFSLEENQQLE